jgi:hypothetical protein
VFEEAPTPSFRLPSTDSNFGLGKRPYGRYVMRKIVPLITALAIAFAGCDDVFESGGDKVATDTFSSAVEVTTQASLRVEAENGGVTVIGAANADSVTVDAVLEVRAGTVEDAQAGLAELDVEIRTTEDAVIVKTLRPEDTDGRTFVVDYEIVVPKDLEVQITNANGGIVVESIENTVVIENANGSMDLQDIIGSFFAILGNGEVAAEVALPADGTIEIIIGNGNVDLFIPVSTSADFSATVGNGSISVVNLTLENMVTTDASVTGRLGSGDGTITLQLGNGTITATGF